MTAQLSIPPFHPIGNFLLRAAYAVLLRLDIQGREHVLKTGPLIIVINHTHFLDPVIPAALLRPDIFPMAKTEVFEGKWGWVFNWYGSFPVRRGEADMQAFKHAFRLLRAGHAILMAPEGTRARSGGLQAAHEGVALIAARTNAPLIPIAQWGGRGEFNRNWKKLKRTPIQVRIGAPLLVKTTSHKPTRDEIHGITDDIMFSLAKMLPPEYRGLYSAVENFAPRYLVPYNSGAVSMSAPKEVLPMPN
ncbi:1-acyl-sn-glycerol-3-phosphate acyltransferase [Anaerolineae bacterium CFX7]|nr:1-acyl-sn-glycerol-3-phosphate acyltransferase [Anaerolineae bacterium CFX7]